MSLKIICVECSNSILPKQWSINWIIWMYIKCFMDKIYIPWWTGSLSHRIRSEWRRNKLQPRLRSMPNGSLESQISNPLSLYNRHLSKKQRLDVIKLLFAGVQFSNWNLLENSSDSSVIMRNFSIRFMRSPWRRSLIFPHDTRLVIGDEFSKHWLQHC